MDFGKLPSIENVNFILPPDPPGNAAVLAKPPTRQMAGQAPKGQAAYVGATGWAMKEWVGKVYPKNAKPKDFLHHYARQFNTIELNTTHYHIPGPATIGQWHRQPATDFQFCPKVLQAISHSADLGENNSLTEQFCASLAGLEEKLGCCFIQLPPYFGPDRLPVLEGFLKRFSLPLAVELRHESWFGHPSHAGRLFGLLEKYEVAAVVTDVAGRRDVCHLRLTTKTAMVRFVGNNLHPTDFTRLDAWAARLKEWFSAGLERVYFFTHTPDNVLAPELAIYLVDKLAQVDGLLIRGPVLLEQKLPGEQMSLF